MFIVHSSYQKCLVDISNIVITQFYDVINMAAIGHVLKITFYVIKTELLVQITKYWDQNVQIAMALQLVEHKMFGGHFTYCYDPVYDVINAFVILRLHTKNYILCNTN